jgi:hypothetical protein
MTDDGLNRSNIIIVGKRQLLKVAFALIVMAIFNKRMIINKFKTEEDKKWDRYYQSSR